MVQALHTIRAWRIEENRTRVDVEAYVFPPYRHHEMEQRPIPPLPSPEWDNAGDLDDEAELECWACDVRLPFDSKDRPIFGTDAAHAIELSVKFAKLMFDYSGYAVEPSSPDGVPLDLANFPLTLVKTIRVSKVIDGETRHTSARIYAPHYHADFDMWFCPLQFPFLGPKMDQRSWGGDAAEAAEMGEAKVMEFLAHYGFTIVPDE